MADEELLKQDEKEQGEPEVVVNDGKWTPRIEIRWNKHASTRPRSQGLSWWETLGTRLASTWIIYN